MLDDIRPSESYSLSNLPAFDQSLATRTVQTSAGFFLKHLQPGMRVLDCGCGPGTITLGLAEVVAAGEVVGIDIDVDGLDAARSRAAAQGITNVRFESGNIYDLRYPDGSFDAVFAHALLVHLSDPAAALRQMTRMLRPGGVIGIRDADRGFDLRLPETPRLKEMFDLWVRVLVHNGASPFYARHQRELLIEVGLQNVTANAFALTYGTAEETHRNAQGTGMFFLVSLGRP